MSSVTLHVVELFYGNLQSADAGTIASDARRRLVRKWTVVPAGKATRRLIQAIACAPGG